MNIKYNTKLKKISKIRGLIKNIFFSSIIFLIFLCFLEILLRSTHLFNARISFSEPDPILAWRFTPGHTYWGKKENDHTVTGRINSYGWRDKEWAIKKPINTYRIAVLGDSYVEAFQVESDYTFLALTERQLNEKYKLKVELMNFGRGGYTQTEELLVLKNEVVKFSPDMVVLFFFPVNDIKDVSRETAGNLIRPFYNVSKNGKLILDTSFVEKREFKIKCLINWFKQHSALISLLCERYNSYKMQKQARAESMTDAKRKKTIQKKIEGYLSICTDKPAARYLRGYQLNKILIKAMWKYCKDKEIRFMLVTIDTPVYIPGEEKKYKLIDPTFDANFFEDDLKSFAKSINIEYLGLQRIFRQSFENKGIPLHWEHGHWNYEGHKIVANALIDKIISILSPNTSDE